MWIPNQRHESPQTEWYLTTLGGGSPARLAHRLLAGTRQLDPPPSWREGPAQGSNKVGEIKINNKKKQQPNRFLSNRWETNKKARDGWQSEGTLSVFPSLTTS